jgi:hypothetical protein
MSKAKKRIFPNLNMLVFALLQDQPAAETA